MKFYAGTKSDLKINGIKNVLNKYYENEYNIVSYNAESNVSCIPENEEIINGSINRSINTYRNFKDENGLYIGIETGISIRYDNIYSETWCTFYYKGKYYNSYSSGMKIPDYIIKKMGEGFSPVEIIEEKALKNNENPRDTWLIYTNFKLSRVAEIEESFRNNLLYFLNNR